MNFKRSTHDLISYCMIHITTQQDEINFVDIFDEEAGSGVCGRILDILSLNGYKPGAVSVNGIASTLRSGTVPTVVIASNGYQQFNPTAYLTGGVSNTTKAVNPASSIRSSIYAETWADSFYSSLAENDLLYDELESAFLNATFPTTDLGMQLSSVAKVMKTKGMSLQSYICQLSAVFQLFLTLALALAPKDTRGTDRGTLSSRFR